MTLQTNNHCHIWHLTWQLLILRTYLSVNISNSLTSVLVSQPSFYMLQQILRSLYSWAQKDKTGILSHLNHLMPFLNCVLRICSSGESCLYLVTLLPDCNNQGEKDLERLSTRAAWKQNDERDHRLWHITLKRDTLHCCYRTPRTVRCLNYHLLSA